MKRQFARRLLRFVLLSGTRDAANVRHTHTTHPVQSGEVGTRPAQQLLQRLVFVVHHLLTRFVPPETTGYKGRGGGQNFDDHFAVEKVHTIFTHQGYGFPYVR